MLACSKICNLILDSSWHVKIANNSARKESCLFQQVFFFRALRISEVTVTVISHQLICGCAEDPKDQGYQIFNHVKL